MLTGRGVYMVGDCLPSPWVSGGGLQAAQASSRRRAARRCLVQWRTAVGIVSPPDCLPQSLLPGSELPPACFRFLPAARRFLFQGPGRHCPASHATTARSRIPRVPARPHHLSSLPSAYRSPFRAAKPPRRSVLATCARRRGLRCAGPPRPASRRRRAARGVPACPQACILRYARPPAPGPAAGRSGPTGPGCRQPSKPTRNFKFAAGAPNLKFRVGSPRPRSDSLEAFRVAISSRRCRPLGPPQSTRPDAPHAGWCRWSPAAGESAGRVRNVVSETAARRSVVTRP